MVSNADSGEITTDTTTTITKYSVTYGTKPQVSSGVDYWLVRVASNFTGYFDYLVSSGEQALYVSGTYATFPTGDAWHTHTHNTNDYGIYAVYAAAGGPYSASDAGVLSGAGALARGLQMNRSYSGAL
jgi:hypothetical protein